MTISCLLVTISFSPVVILAKRALKDIYFSYGPAQAAFYLAKRARGHRTRLFPGIIRLVHSPMALPARLESPHAHVRELELSKLTG